jgi:hypothetical protein
MKTKALIRFGLWATLLASGAAAANVTEQGAQSLANSLRGWFAMMLGPDAPDLPVRAAPEGDHYRVVVPVVGLRAKTAEPAVSAAARPLSDGRWQIDDISLPPTFAFAARPRRPGAEPGTATVIIADQHGEALIDPSLAGPSTFAVRGSGISIASSDASGSQEQRIDRYSAAGAVTPAAGALLDVSEDAEMAGWRSAAITPGEHATGSAAHLVRARMRIGGLARERAPAVVEALVGLGAALPAPVAGEKGSASLTPSGRAALHRLVLALSGIATSARFDETLEGVQFEIAGIGAAAVDQVRVGLGGVAAGGLLRAWLNFAADGLSFPGLPAGPAGLALRHVSFRPSVSGIPIDALNRLLAAASDDHGAGRLDREFAALFAEGDLTVGIEGLEVVIGPATFEGAGSVLLASPTEREGQARLSATGFDALLDQIRGNSRLQQLWPLFALARGLAKPEADRLVWTIAADRSGNLTVNGTDLSTLFGRLRQGGTQ